MTYTPMAKQEDMIIVPDNTYGSQDFLLVIPTETPIGPSYSVVRGFNSLEAAENYLTMFESDDDE